MASLTDVAALAERVERLANEVGLLNDVQAIRKLQHAYGYYLNSRVSVVDAGIRVA
jgi:hypothetical protein